MKFSVVYIMVLVAVYSMAASASNDKAIIKSLRKQDCFKCHSISRKKDGPSYKKIAEKHTGDSDAVATLVTRITRESEIEVDGNKEKHKALKGDATAVAEWILSQ